MPFDNFHNLRRFLHRVGGGVQRLFPVSHRLQPAGDGRLRAQLRRRPEVLEGVLAGWRAFVLRRHARRRDRRRGRPGRAAPPGEGGLVVARQRGFLPPLGAVRMEGREGGEVRLQGAQEEEGGGNGKRRREDGRVEEEEGALVEEAGKHAASGCGGKVIFRLEYRNLIRKFEIIQNRRCNEHQY